MELELNWIKSDIEMKHTTYQYFQDSCMCTDVSKNNSKNKTQAAKQQYK